MENDAQFDPEKGAESRDMSFGSDEGHAGFGTRASYSRISDTVGQTGEPGHGDRLPFIVRDLELPYTQSNRPGAGIHVGNIGEREVTIPTPRTSDITSIRIVQNTDLDAFTNETNALLKEGWKLRGEVRILTFPGVHAGLLYAVVLVR